MSDEDKQAELRETKKPLHLSRAVNLLQGRDPVIWIMIAFPATVLAIIVIFFPDSTWHKLVHMALNPDEYDLTSKKSKVLIEIYGSISWRISIIVGGIIAYIGVITATSRTRTLIRQLNIDTRKFKQEERNSKTELFNKIAEKLHSENDLEIRSAIFELYDNFIEGTKVSIRSSSTLSSFISYELRKKINSSSREANPDAQLSDVIAFQFLTPASYEFAPTDKYDHSVELLSQIFSIFSRKLEGHNETIRITNFRIYEFDLIDVDLKNFAIARTYFHESDLSGCSFHSMDVVHFYNCIMNRCDFRNTALSSVLFKNCYINEANFSNLNIRKFYFSGLLLHATDFSNCVIDEANFCGTRMTDANFQNASAKMAVFQEAILTSANFHSCSLTGANFKNATLGGACFHEADLAKSDLTGSVINRADFSTANNLTFEQVSQAKGDHSTKLPEGMLYPDHWPEQLPPEE